MWSAYSKDKLQNAEAAILRDLKTPHRGFFVDIERSDGKTYKIWTLVFNEESKEIPLLRVHGLGGGEHSNIKYKQIIFKLILQLLHFGQ